MRVFFFSKGVEKCNRAIEGITGEVKSLVEEMASTAGSQERYKKRYEELNKRYNKMSGKLNSLMKQKEQRLLKDKKIGMFIENLKKHPQAIDKWDESLWNLMIEKAIVQADGKIGCILYNGTEITEEA